MKRFSVIFVLFTSLLFLLPSPSKLKAGLIPNIWLRSVALIEVEKNNEYIPRGTGFFVSGKKNNAVLITNAHVFSENKERLPLYVRFYPSHPEGEKVEGDTAIKAIERIKISPLNDKNFQPIFHEKVDLAAVYLPLPVNFPSKEVSGFKNIDFLRYDDIPIGDGVFLIGFPVSIQGIQNLEKEINIPVLRNGIISAKYSRNGSNYFLIDAPTYWGNSGGPVIIKPEFMQVQVDGKPLLPLSPTIPKLIGIVSELLPVGNVWPLNDSTQYNTSIWHSGLSVVIPIDYMIELLDKLPD